MFGVVRGEIALKLSTRKVTRTLQVVCVHLNDCCDVNMDSVDDSYVGKLLFLCLIYSSLLLQL